MNVIPAFGVAWKSGMTKCVVVIPVQTGIHVVFFKSGFLLAQEWQKQKTGCPNKSGMTKQVLT